MGKIGTETKECLSQHQMVCHDVKQVLMPSEWIHCADWGRCSRGHNFTL